MQVLGRKAELPNLLRGVSELPPEARGQVGKAANITRGAIERRLAERKEALAGAEEATRLAADRLDLTLPARRSCPTAPCTSSPAPGATSRRVPRPRLLRALRPRGRDGALKLRRAEPQPDAPATRDDRHVLRDRRRRPAHPHVADADPRDGDVRAAALRRHPRPRVPPRLRRDAPAAVPPGRGPRGRHGHHARRPQRHAHGVRPRDLRRRTRHPPAPALLPVHRAERRDRRRLLQLLRRLDRHRAVPGLPRRAVAGDPRRR